MQYIDWPDQGIPPDPQPFISESLKSHTERERHHTHTETEREERDRYHVSQVTTHKDNVCVCVYGRTTQHILFDCLLAHHDYVIMSPCQVTSCCITCTVYAQMHIIYMYMQ